MLDEFRTICVVRMYAEDDSVASPGSPFRKVLAAT
jgi:hypothetical protein